MAFRLEELAKLVGGILHGDGSTVIAAALPSHCATPDSITFWTKEATAKLLKSANPAAIIVPMGETKFSVPMIEVENPLESILQIAALFQPPRPKPEPGIHPTAVVDPTANIAEDVSIGPLAVVEANVTIGKGSILHPHAVVRWGSHIGESVEIHPHAVLYPCTNVGDRTIIHSGVVLGCDGFGFKPSYPVHRKIPQLGNVTIAEDVEIGANSTVDRATIGSTTIGPSTKLDDQVMIGHNCRIGPRNLLAAHVGMAGSCSTGDMVWMAGKVGIGDHCHIGDGAMLMGMTGVHRDIQQGERLGGAPSRPLRNWAAEQAALAKLPKLIREFNELKKTLGVGKDDEKRKCA